MHLAIYWLLFQSGTAHISNTFCPSSILFPLPHGSSSFPDPLFNPTTSTPPPTEFPHIAPKKLILPHRRDSCDRSQSDPSAATRIYPLPPSSAELTTSTHPPSAALTSSTPQQRPPLSTFPR